MKFSQIESFVGNFYKFNLDCIDCSKNHNECEHKDQLK